MNIGGIGLRIAGLALWSAGCATALAQTGAVSPVGAAEPAPAFKLTVGRYALDGGGLAGSQALDVNLRYTTEQIGDLWLGVYRMPSAALSQVRSGWDKVFTVGPVRVSPSLQSASGGFWGGSVGVETGDSWYVGAGLGRTNLRNYINLNYDPNDAWMFSSGYRWADARSLGIQVVRDNRLNPDQQHVHLVYRAPRPGGQRLTLDTLYKKGFSNGEYVRRVGLSATYDWPRYFVHLTFDPKVNFTPQNMWRLQVGVRF